MIWGLSYLDFSILIAFLIVVLAVGVAASRSIKGQSDFYLGGRKMGRVLQFFLNFGNATDTNAAPTMASQVYSKGVSGMWLQLQTLLFTPFYWFTQPWFRRARVITMADLFIDRFNSKAVASAYAIFNIMVALITLGVGNLGAYSVVEAMMHNAIPKWAFYLGYNLIIAIYITLGGIRAAAITDAIQGILILLMSIVLIPLGLWEVGGFSGLHAKISPDAFWLAGSPYSDFTAVSIAAITFGSFIQILGLQHNMSAAGSAKDENTARFGMIAGGFTKRVILIFWMLCGLLAVAIFSGGNRLANPDTAWGALSSHLLPVGLIGIMLSGMLLGHMPSVGLTAVAISGLVVRNIYEPLFKGLSQKHYLRAGQVFIVVILGCSVAIAWFASGLGSLTAYMITFNTFFGAVVFLLFFWRRLTVPAILISFFIWIFLQAIVAPVIGTTSLRNADAFTIASTVPIYRPAVDADVQAGMATTVGQPLPQTVALFFDKPLVLKDKAHPEKGFGGDGHFLIENYLLYRVFQLFGIDMGNFSFANLATCRWLFDGFFPFLCLIFFSLLTKPSVPERAPAFYAKMKTPIAATPELDVVEVEKSSADPRRFDHQKLFPRSNWEFARWTKSDFLGFFACYGIVGLILGFLWLVLHVGKSGSWF